MWAFLSINRDEISRFWSLSLKTERNEPCSYFTRISSYLLTFGILPSFLDGRWYPRHKIYLQLPPFDFIFSTNFRKFRNLEFYVRYCFSKTFPWFPKRILKFYYFFKHRKNYHCCSQSTPKSLKWSKLGQIFHGNSENFQFSFKNIHFPKFSSSSGKNLEFNVLKNPICLFQGSYPFGPGSPKLIFYVEYLSKTVTIFENLKASLVIGNLVSQTTNAGHSLSDFPWWRFRWQGFDKVALYCRVLVGGRLQGSLRKVITGNPYWTLSPFLVGHWV